MVTAKWLLVALVVTLIAVPPCLADDPAQLVGAWKLVSWEREIQESGKRIHFFGKKPTGSLIFTPEGRMMQIITAEGRTAPTSQQERAALLDSMSALAGTYRVDGDKLIVNYDVAWHPARVGAEETRSFRVESNRLHLIGGWVPATTAATSGRMGRSLTTWERVK